MKIPRLCITSLGKLAERKRTPIKIVMGDVEVGEIIAFGNTSTTSTTGVLPVVFDRSGMPNE